MSDYWISKAAELESQLDQAKAEIAETVKRFEEKISELEKLLLEANINALGSNIDSK